MPPMFINIGAYVDEGTLVDSHALVGSCAQVGKRVHISAAAQIGGVIEPVGALPVIVEDDVLVGGNTGIYEGAVIKTRAVIAAGTVLTGSTPVYDLPAARIIRPEAGQPLVVPEGAVVVPGARAVTVGAGREWGLVAGDAGHREVPRRSHRHAHGARSVDPVDPVALARQLIDIDSTTGREGEVAAVLAALPARARLFGARAAARQRPHQRDRRHRRAAARVLDALRLRAAVLRQPRSKAICSTGEARAMRRGFSPRRSRQPSGCARRARRASASCLWRARSGAATARWRPTRSRRGRDFLDQRRADRQPARRGDARRVPRAGSSQQAARRIPVIPELGESAIEKLLDVLTALRARALARGRCARARRITRSASSTAASRPTWCRRTPRRRSCSARVGDHDDAAHDPARDGRRIASSIEEVLEVPPVRLRTLPGFDTAVFAYTTDIPVLDRWGTPLLLGPGLDSRGPHRSRAHLRSPSCTRRSSCTCGSRQNCSRECLTDLRAHRVLH